MKNFLLSIVVAIGMALGAPTLLAQTFNYAGVEIGSKGIKGALWEQKRSKEHWEPTVFYAEKNNVNIISSILPGQATFSNEAIGDATKAVKLILERMREQAVAKKLIKVTYFVVASSGVASASNRDELKASVKEATGLSIDFITTDDESEYGMLAVVPRKDRSKIILMDIGSGNTKVGYWNDQFARYVATSIPYGSVSLRNKVKAETGNYSENLQHFLDSDIGPEYAKITENRPSFKNRKKIYWLGGAGWATNTFTHPESLSMQQSQLSRNDVEKFIALLESDKWLDDSHFSNIPPIMRDKAFEEMRRVRDTFSKQDLLAGVGLMRTLLKESHPEPIIIFPVRNSQWLYGYPMKKMIE